jgi:hypothetical protein
VVRDEGGRVIRIIEQRDIELIAEARVRQPLLDLTEGNCPLYALRAATLRRYASELLNANAQGQFYLTDIVEAISREGGDIRALTTSVADPDYDLLCADVTRPVDLALLEGLLSSAGHLLHSGEAAIAEAARAIAAERPAVQVLSIARQLEELYATAEREKLGFSPTWRIRPTARLFSRRKSLIFRRPIGAHGPKLAVVKTYPIPNPAPMCIMGSRYVFALHHAKEKRQGTPLL